jgi:hypothetical protein
MRKVIVGGVNCTHMEEMILACHSHPAVTYVGDFLRSELAIMEKANRKYLKKRGTVRLLQLLKNSFWTSPFRSALILDVLNRRAVAVKVKAKRGVRASASVA